MTDEDDKVKKLPVRFQKRPDETRSLFHPWEVGQSVCYHKSFIVDQTKDTVTCADCKEQLNPMWVLHQLSNEERNYNQSFIRAQEAMNRLEERSRTKCEWCHKMTRISHR